MLWEDERDSAMLPTNITYSYISFEMQSFLAIHNLFRNGNVSLFTNFKFGFLNFSSLQKPTTPRLSVSQPKVSSVMSQLMTMILVLKACSTYFTSISKLIPHLHNTNIKQKKSSSSRRYALIGLKQIKTLIQKFLKR